MSSLDLKISKFSDSTTSRSKLFQSLTTLVVDIVNKQNDVLFTAKAQSLEDNTARIQITITSPL